MQLTKSRLSTAVGTVLAAMWFASAAYAGCGALDSLPAPGQPAAPRAAPQAPGVNGFSGVQFVQASTRASFLPVDWRWSDPAPIVGLWHMKFVVDNGTPDGLVVDEGFTTWHDDGTELMNSGRAPMTGSFCMGVWKRVGPATFSLNHWALSWDDSGKQLIGPTNIREVVTVDRRGTTYTGTFTLTQYLPDGKTPAGDPAAGKVVATRINP
jgi:hypothetical protein